VQVGDGDGVEVLIVDEQDVASAVAAVLIAPGELERDDVPGDLQPSPEPLPGRTLRDSLPDLTLKRDELNAPGGRLRAGLLGRTSGVSTATSWLGRTC
jgi:hypothetical protein